MNPPGRVLPEWLEGHLRCPACGSEAKQNDGGFECPEQHLWPIVREVPRFVDSESYSGSFGYQWNRFARTQLDTETRHRSRDAFLRRTGFTPANLEGKLVLDVGCGSGRYSDIAGRFGGNVVGIDLSLAVEAAHRNLRERDNTAFLQADIFSLPFAESTFDFIFSIGVLHHTPDTRAAFLRLPPLLRPGGRISIWVYPREWASPGSGYLRRYTTRMKPDTLLRLAKAAHPLYHLKRRIPKLAASALNYLLPTSMEDDPDWRVLDTFDWYSPTYQWKHAYPEVFGWFEEAGLEDIRPLPDAVSMTALRPR